jgi:undecaprenyl-diphosphatase
VGVAQAFALAPGVSRSGITLTAALLLGLSRPEAARFGFLLSMPITAGAGVLKLRHLVTDGIPTDERAAFAVGIGVSFVVGLAVIGGLLRYVRTQSMDVFAAYRLTMGTIVVVMTVVRG